MISEIAEATQQNRQMKIKLFITYHNSKWRGNTITFHRGIVHCNLATGFLDLNEQCVQKLLDFMSLNDLAAIHNTCVSTQQAVKLYLKENTVRMRIVQAN